MQEKIWCGRICAKIWVRKGEEFCCTYKERPKQEKKGKVTACTKIRFKFIYRIHDRKIFWENWHFLVLLCYLIERHSILGLLNYAYYQNICARERKLEWTFISVILVLKGIIPLNCIAYCPWIDLFSLGGLFSHYTPPDIL